MASENFVDYVKLCCRSGKGGAGSTHMHRDRMTSKGGPDGGDGGRGGHVILRGNTQTWTLLHLKYRKHIKAGHGESGGANRRHGADGKDEFLDVPIGTVVRDADSKEIVGEITEDGQEWVLIPGGRGGLGNDHFKSPTNQTPRYAQPGEDGQEVWRILELKLLADVGLVGFPNAGKSTLFNRLASSRVSAADQLFATLDPTLRAIALPRFGKVVLADTIGFVRHLPHQLVAAFKATLEEAAEADLLLHVIDAAADEVEENISAVDDVLVEIGAGDIPALHVMNKIDCLPEVTAHTDTQSDVNAEGDVLELPRRVWLSAQDNTGIDGLTEAIAQLLGGAFWRGQVVLAARQAKLRARLYAVGAVQAETVSELGDYQLELCFPRDDLERIMAAERVALPH
mgnify:CR=1 FL=1